MNVNLKNLVSITEANQNFSQVVKMAEKHGTVVILKNNTPKYVLIEYDRLQNSISTDDITIGQATVEYLREKDSESVFYYHLVWALKAVVSELKEKDVLLIFQYPIIFKIMLA